ncbi:MAG: acyl-CoA dehydrogenase domain protein [Alphaproteobacteria bacterium]|nr:acyl-CoA dehydrogenase domain protein [Alphaproteobacteria bacterium]
MFDIDHSLTETERAAIARAGDFATAYVAPRAQAWQDAYEFPRQALVDACAAGLADLELSTAHGGQGLGFIAKLRAFEAIARQDMAFSFSLINHHNSMTRIARDAKGDVRDLIAAMRQGEIIGCTALTEPGAGSDFAAIKTTAQKDGDGWILNGSKAWITNAAVAGAVICYAQTEPGSGWRGIAAFLVRDERAGFVREAPFRFHGGSAIGAGGFRLENYRAKADEMLQPPGAGFKAAMAGINGARTYVAGMCCAMLDAGIETAARYATQRRIFGQPVLEHQGQRWALADSATDLEAARLLTDKAASIVQQGGDAVLAAAHCKKFAVRVALKGLADCIQLMGAEGLKNTHVLGRHLTNAKLCAFTDGSTEIQNERIGRFLMEKFSE